MRPLVLAVACGGLLGAMVTAQAPRTTQSEPRPVFRLATRLVEVGVIVHDRTGRPVPGLTADDFRLYDNGKQERVEFFRIESGEAPAEEPAPAAPGEFSNQRARRAGTVTVILFDRLNTAWQDQVMARQSIIGFLRQLTPEDRVALYLLESNSVRVVHDFTRDARALLRALARVDATTSRELAAANEDPLPAPETGDLRLDAEIAAWLRDTSEMVAAEFTGRRAEATLSALEAIAGRLAGVTGRKNLLWVSSGFPRVLTDQGFTNTFSVEMRRATVAINNANIAIYPVDARGLVGAFTPQSATRGPSFATMSMVRPNIDTMLTLAADTGGRAFYNTNDISGAIRRAIDDGRVTYVLGYYPSHERWDGRFRELKVKVGRPGVEVRHRRGYLALADRPADASARETALADAARSPLEAAGLGLTVRIEAGEPGPDGRISIVITVAPQGVTLRAEGPRWIGTVDVLIVQDLPGGRVRTSGYFTVHLDMTEEQRDRLARGGIVARREVELLDAAHQVHVVARDVPTGRTGSVVVLADDIRAAARR